MIRLVVNGQAREVAADPETPLLYVLRNDLGLTGTKFGCGLGQCGSCTVLVGGQAVRSCMLPVQAVDGQAVTTIEGLGSPERPHPLQAAFIAEQAVQCGYCTPGIILAAKAALDQTPRPTEAAAQARAGRCPVPVRDARSGDPGGHACGRDDGRGLRWLTFG